MYGATALVDDWLEPAASVVRKIGGVEMTAVVCGVTKQTVYKWFYPTHPASGARGTGGLIPADRQQIILEWSRRNGNPVKPDDFFIYSRQLRSA